jgi:uncharacterized protein YbaR (Trm112 family)
MLAPDDAPAVVKLPRLREASDTIALGCNGLVCEKCRLKYPVREDIPVMLVDEAEKLG